VIGDETATQAIRSIDQFAPYVLEAHILSPSDSYFHWNGMHIRLNFIALSKSSTSSFKPKLARICVGSQTTQNLIHASTAL
jgi:hypothetical protein